MSDEVRLIYWPVLQGRGEPIRLLLEDAGIPYVDAARAPEGGFDLILQYRSGDVEGFLPYAPPILEHGTLRIAQTANITMYLAERFDLLPEGEHVPWQLNQLMLTVMDVFAEAHDTHHPVSTALYYEDQKAEAITAATAFVRQRLPLFVRYFERVLERSGGPFVLGADCTYVDLALFQLAEGLAFAFPKGFAAQDRPRWAALVEAVRSRENVAAYLASERRLPFNEHGIFRAYPELDVEPVAND